ncbi:uncharacterized protein [Dermacentor albipictus]|uniref:uncharacterized protein isoform X1 n=1 Tax=Dermacentor albipictus TaxID=60249 RepID=UPI0038FD29C4
MPHTRKSKPASPSRSPPRPPAAGGSPRSRDSEFSEDGDALVARFSALVDQLHVTAEENRPPAADGEEDDAQSSVSGVTAVAAARPAGPAGGAERRCQDIQDEVFAFCSAPANKVPVDARLFVMRKVSELVALCSGLMSEAAAERGAVAALRGQLAEVRREVAAVQRRAGVAECRLESLVGAVTDPACAGLPGAGFAAAVGAAASEAGRLSSVGAAGAYASGAGPMAPGAASYAAALRSGGFLDAGAAPVAPGGAARGPAQPLHDHVCFLTPTAQTTAPARDVVRLLKANIDPAAKGIKDVSLRHTRYGVTVFSDIKQSIDNLHKAIQENAVTRAALIVRVAEKRNPHVRFSGVDPDVAPQDFIERLNDRNPGLNLDPAKCRVRVTFKERSGTNAYIAEVDPSAFRALLSRQRLSVGWTMVRAHEDLHVTTCTFCATYGHGRTTCPVRADAAKAVCMRCAGNHLGDTCQVRMGDEAVRCAECDRAGLSSAHPAGFPQCPILMERVARLRARTNYGDP